MRHLLLIKDDQGERTVELDENASSIGRDERNSIVLHSASVSRQHAILLRVTQPGNNTHTFRLTDGNLQGHPSTNGILVNGKGCSSHCLQHGDLIHFGAQVEGQYITVDEDVDLTWLMSDEAEAQDYMSTLIAVPKPGIVNAASHKLDDSALARLASFPELFFHPIIEVSLAGELTYLNPAAVRKFPTIQAKGLDHPILAGVIEAAKNSQTQQFIRELFIRDEATSPPENRIFEQSISYIPQSELIRSYLVEVTDRKRAENKLRALHSKLELEVERRTLQFNEASERLKDEEQALLASYATNRALLNAMPDPMFRINGGGTIVNVKASKQTTLPFDPEACKQRHIAEILPGDTAITLQTCIDSALATEEIQVLEFELTAAEAMPEAHPPLEKIFEQTLEQTFEHGLYFEARLAVSAPNEVMVIIRDITKRKLGEAEVHRRLERERELNEMKTRFVSMTSHEFRTPLTAILSSAELLERGNEIWAAEKKLTYLNKIKTAACHMTELLNDVLLINRAEAGRVEFNPQKMILEEFCSGIIEEVQMGSKCHQLVLRSHLPRDPILIDRKLMRHILTNLLSNAINYSPNGGEVIVTLNQTDGDISLQVQDSGIGIPESARATLFDSFVRGSNVGTISGTGLGLAIVKKSVDLHQGQIDCQSTVGEGTTFSIRLPIHHIKAPSDSSNKTALTV